MVQTGVNGKIIAYFYQCVRCIGKPLSLIRFGLITIVQMKDIQTCPPQQAYLLNLMCWILLPELSNGILNHFSRRIALRFFRLHHISLQCNCTVTSTDHSLKAFALSIYWVMIWLSMSVGQGQWKVRGKPPIKAQLLPFLLPVFLDFF